MVFAFSGDSPANADGSNILLLQCHAISAMSCDYGDIETKLLSY